MNVYGVAREVAVALRPAAAAARPSTFAEKGAPASAALDVDDRGARPVPALLRARARRAHRPVAGLAARAPRAGGRAPDQQRRRPHQLRDDGDGPADPRLRPGARSRRRALAVRWARDGRDARRPSTASSARCTPAHRRRGRPRRRRWPWPASWAAPRARCPTRRASWRSRPPTGTRSPSAAAAKALGMHTEASHRFERGADPGGAAARPRAHRAPAGRRSARARRARA